MRTVPILCVLAALAVLTDASLAQTPAERSVGRTLVTGIVTSNGLPVPFAHVGVSGATYGVAADAAGAYRLEGLPAGTWTLVVSAVGYEAAEYVIVLEEDEHLEQPIRLREAVIENEGVVVTGTLVETFVRDSPVKVDVVSSSYLAKTPTSNIMQAIDRVNGLRQQIDCGVCGTNNIRIYGMDGPYSAVLIDGMPVMSSLAAVYGLNGISPALIRQVEVIKGPMSTLYGTEALAGVINIITKSPRISPRFSVAAFANDHGEYSADFGFVPLRGSWSGLLSGTLAYNQRFVDQNGDRFTDIPLNKRISLFAKLGKTDRQGRQRLSLSGRYYAEDRLGGARSFVDRFHAALRGSTEYYGETIRTERAELLGMYALTPDRGAWLEFAANDHVQDSYYGDQYYRARQSGVFGRLARQYRPETRQSVLVGADLRGHSYDDNTGSTGCFDAAGRLLENRPDRRWIPGVFTQHEVSFARTMRLLSGLRVDRQRDHGWIFSPRLAFKARPHDRTTLRLNAGTGFRVVNLFTEDHAAYAGARATVVLEDLDPERSWSAAASGEQIVPFGGNPLTLGVDLFHTHFSNKIEPDYSVPGEIRYANLDGFAVTRGVSATLSQNFGRPSLRYSVGFTAMDVFREEHGQRYPIEFAPDYQGNASVTWTHSRRWTIDYTAVLTGPMKLPEYPPPFSRSAWSPAFATHDVQVTYDLDIAGSGVVQVYGSVRNVFGYAQPSPLVDPDRPFGESFDTTYVYGPLYGRTVGLGLRVMAL